MNNKTDNGSAFAATSQDVAWYIAIHTADLAKMACAVGLVPLAYLLDMAAMEAENELKSAGAKPAIVTALSERDAAKLPRSGQVVAFAP